MQKKLTITIDEEVYKGLHAVIGRGRISRFLEDLARPHVHQHPARPRRSLSLSSRPRAPGARVEG